RVDAVALPERAPGPPATLAGQETILLVDDDNQVRTVALTILRKHGYLVLAAPDADEAHGTCTHHPHPIHLLVTDAQVTGVTGGELARRLRGIRPELKVLCMSGTDEVLDAVAAEPP